ncbi:hypothetical protein JQK15_13520 [Sphingobium sp. BHU LFT2]|uniref:hypothetical protein n=1 Tax=Sphingobium sp. BHU LFT2 TaxID=2807634 RepID=UPI001BE971FF|nr:hypothetical protein [Sphingobium sp. BHU LFT2]MBT2244558.1 hypothetical protein [Sphingobium sp. BHU LFT2]
MNTIKITIPLLSGQKDLSFPVDMDKLMAIYSAYRFNKHPSAFALVQSFLGRKLELNEVSTAQAADDIAMVRELLADAVDLNAHRKIEEGR